MEEHMDCITLPHSGVKIHFTSQFDPNRLADLTRQLLSDPKLSVEMRANPTTELAKLGIHIDASDRKLISDEDLLQGMGLRAKQGSKPGEPGETQLAPAVVIIAVVVLFGKDG